MAWCVVEDNGLCARHWPGTVLGWGCGVCWAMCHGWIQVLQSQVSQLRIQVPSRLWLQGNLLGIFFFGYWGTKIVGMCRFSTAPLYSFGSWGSYSFCLCCPRAGTQNLMQVGTPCSCSAPSSRAWSPGTSKSTIRVPSASCDPRAG